MKDFRVQGSGFRIAHKAATVGRDVLIANRCETASGFFHPSSLIPHPSSFIPHPSSFIPHPSHSGISLMEVLISIFVLSIGLLGIAALIPLGQLSMLESTKSDRTGSCGRAAMREIQVRRMLDFRSWSPAPAPTEFAPFALDPLGVFNGLNQFGPMTRRTFSWILTDPATGQPNPPDRQSELVGDFFLRDDLIFDTIKNSASRPSLPQTIGLTNEFNYSWFLTVTPAATEATLLVANRRLFNVSVVVCYKRNFDPNSLDTSEGEHTATINDNNNPQPGFPGMGIGGGTVILANSTLPNSPKINVKENQWVMLHYIDPTGTYPQLNRCSWYRVVGVGMDVSPPNGPTLSLNGPDWDPNLPATLVVVPGAIGVYSTTMELDWDPLWDPLWNN